MSNNSAKKSLGDAVFGPGRWGNLWDNYEDEILEAAAEGDKEAVARVMNEAKGSVLEAFAAIRKGDKSTLEAAVDHAEAAAASSSIFSTVKTIASGLREALECRLVKAAEDGDIAAAAEIMNLLNEAIVAEQKLEVYKEEVSHLRREVRIDPTSYLNDRIRLQKEIFGEDWGGKK